MTDNFIPASLLIIITLWLVWIIEGKAHNWALEGFLLVGIIAIHAIGNSWTDRLMNDDSFTDPIPSNQADFVALVTARDDYKNRKARDDA